MRVAQGDPQNGRRPSPTHLAPSLHRASVRPDHLRRDNEPLSVGCHFECHAYPSSASWSVSSLVLICPVARPHSAERHLADSWPLSGLPRRQRPRNDMDPLDLPRRSSGATGGYPSREGYRPLDRDCRLPPSINRLSFLGVFGADESAPLLPMGGSRECRPTFRTRMDFPRDPE